MAPPASRLATDYRFVARGRSFVGAEAEIYAAPDFFGGSAVVGALGVTPGIHLLPWLDFKAGLAATAVRHGGTDFGLAASVGAAVRLHRGEKADLSLFVNHRRGLPIGGSGFASAGAGLTLLVR